MVRMNGRSSASEFLIGLILGVTAGALISFLLTPRSGREVRELLKEKTSDISETVKELTSDREKVYKETWRSRKGQPKISQAYFE